MSVTSARTLQTRRSIVTEELRGCLRSRTEVLANWLSSPGTTSLIAEKSPAWVCESELEGGGGGLLPARSFPRRARRLARVGGLLSLSDIPPESSIVTPDFRASGGVGQSPREGQSAAR